ncbi:hypothetical protein C0Q70_04144 [Pomacea canaliculata]|uniref:Uncharacterized protein n=1 Tax=Pomacea canaliculata TaxID=400727 RepID=A0A2T7PUR1_POMCA|nr:hypothetical protein C0Q70_04144 [Pomacea canaliculata]
MFREEDNQEEHRCLRLGPPRLDTHVALLIELLVVDIAMCNGEQATVAVLEHGRVLLTLIGDGLQQAEGLAVVSPRHPLIDLTASVLDLGPVVGRKGRQLSSLLYKTSQEVLPNDSAHGCIPSAIVVTALRAHCTNIRAELRPKVQALCTGKHRVPGRERGEELRPLHAGGRGTSGVCLHVCTDALTLR